MKKKYRNIIFFLLIFCYYSAHSQAQNNCTVPFPPVLTSVSVQPETGKTEFTWTLSPSPDIAGYIIYAYENEAGLAIDTVWDAAATHHIISNTAPKYSSVSYVVAAHTLPAEPGKPGCTSALSNVLSTIFCQADLDTCNKKINVAWNSYPSEPIAVTGYTIYLSVNGGEYTEETSTGPDITHFTIDNFLTGVDYCFYIRANLEGSQFSTSNKACLLTRMQRPPDWINADYATVNSESKVMLSFSVDPASEITQFMLERRTGTGGTFAEVTRLQAVNGEVQYTDNEADDKVVNIYRLSAINSCNNPVTVSNIASNIVLSLERKAEELKLSWNLYREWLGKVSAYRLFADTGNGFEEKAVIAETDSMYTLDYRDIMYGVTSDKICLLVTAGEIDNPHGIAGESSSCEVCMKPIEVITVPNLFTPNNDLTNDLFKPVISFTPSDYHLIISNQHGAVLFDTRDYNESWDGTMNGNPQPDGICLWFLKVTTPSGKNLTRTGTVTILKNP
ncbi:MAG: gliding motility-associated C-terminal domain-containing protein [Bacteroidales bacterium]|nr:gliding motility-associated C-terminal domain-containing protein [Bacteroidales bacterium]